MSNSQPASARVLQQLLQGSTTPVSQSLLSQSYGMSRQDQTAVQQPTSQSVPTAQSDLDILDEVVTTVEQTARPAPSVLDQALPRVVTQQNSQPQVVGGRQKEAIESSATVAAAELPAGVQYVEQEPVPEIPPEVESYIERVVNTPVAEQQPVVIAQDAVPPTPQQPTPPRIVRVLPITKAQEEVGMRKSTNFSIRWLVEFGHKIARMFMGGVVYRE